MKKTVLSILTCLAIGSWANAQNVNIPDANFKNALLAHGASAPVNGVNPITQFGATLIDTNNDGEIQVSEAQSYAGTINCSNQNISDLTGVEAFINHTELIGHTNPLTNIDVSQNTALISLSVGQTQLTSLDISANVALTSLAIPNCQITHIDLSNNSALTYLSCENNQLNSLDVSTNTALIQVYCQGNQLTSLNVANGSNGTSSPDLHVVNATNNANLTCIQHDSGFDPTTNSNWTKDGTASWSDNCPPVSSCTNIVNIPDANFKTALLNHSPVIDTDGDDEICESEAQAFTGTIKVHQKNINDLTGIEAFTNISGLWCFINNLSNLDVSSNTSLTDLRCANNQITSLDLTNNPNLANLAFATNQLTSLDLSNNTLITLVDGGNNSMSNLNLGNNSVLNYFWVMNNSLTEIDLSMASALIQVDCRGNQLTSLNVANGNNSALTLFDARNNSNLICIQNDTGFDPTTASNWQKDATASWSDNCSGNGSSGINENNISFSIVPNPTSGMVKIETDVEINSVEIFSTSGQQVASFETKAFDISALQSGVYFVKVLSDSGLFTTRIIKE